MGDMCQDKVMGNGYKQMWYKHLFIHKTIGRERGRGRLVTVRGGKSSISRQGRMRIDMGCMCQDKVTGNG